jgi:copper chaperone CopZ
MHTKEFKIHKLHTTNDALNLKDSIFSIFGVSNVSVSVDSPKVIVTYNPSIVEESSIEDTINNFKR